MRGRRTFGFKGQFEMMDDPIDRLRFLKEMIDIRPPQEGQRRGSIS